MSAAMLDSEYDWPTKLTNTILSPGNSSFIRANKVKSLANIFLETWNQIVEARVKVESGWN